MTFAEDLVNSIRQNVREFESELSAGNGEGTREVSLGLVDPSPIDDPAYNLPWTAFRLLEKIRADIHALESALVPTREKLLLISLAPLKAKALNTAVELGISDAIDKLGGEVELTKLSQYLKVHPNKLGIVLRILVEDHVHLEPRLNHFSNSRHSKAFKAEIKGAQPMLSLMTVECFDAARGLHDSLTKDEYRNSFSPEHSPFSIAAHPEKTFLDYIANPNHVDTLQKVVDGVVPWLNVITRSALIRDFPWNDLGHVRVIDLGSGPGDVGRDLLPIYPHLKWTFQDLPEVCKTEWPALETQLSAAGVRDRAEFVEQDYFEANKSEGDVFFLRGVLREYDDPEAIRVLQNAANAMKKRQGARLLINEIICGTPKVAKELGAEFVSSYQSENIGTANIMALNAYLLFGGRERSWAEMESVIKSAGLSLVKFYPLRTFTAMIECKVAA